MDCGQLLEAQGWEQGDVLPFPGEAFVDLASFPPTCAYIAPSRFPSFGILSTQTCDIVKKEETEPYVEILRLRVGSQGDVRSARLMHPRMFLVDQDHSVVADIQIKGVIKKRELLRFEPSKVLDAARLSRFADWLGARTSRPAVPEVESNLVMRPLRSFLQSLSKEAPDSPSRMAADLLEDLRVGFAAVEPAVVYDLYCVAARAPSQEEGLAIMGLVGRIEGALSTGALLRASHVVTTDQMSVAEWRRTLPVEATALTYASGEVSGEEPQGLSI